MMLFSNWIRRSVSGPGVSPWSLKITSVSVNVIVGKAVVGPLMDGGPVDVSV